MRALRRHRILGFNYSHVLLISLTSNKSLIGAVSNDTGLYVICKNNGKSGAGECWVLPMQTSSKQQVTIVQNAEHLWIEPWETRDKELKGYVFIPGSLPHVTCANGAQVTYMHAYRQIRPFTDERRLRLSQRFSLRLQFYEDVMLRVWACGAGRFESIVMSWSAGSCSRRTSLDL